MTDTRLVKMVIVALMFVGCLGFSETSRAASGSGSASAEMISPLEIIFKTPLDFGDFTIGTNGGTIVVNPNDFGIQPFATLDVILIDQASAGRGEFGFSGEPNRTYATSGDSSVTITLFPGGGSPMTASLVYRTDSDGIRSDAALPNTDTTGTINGLGTDILGVGGILQVPSGQPGGQYKGQYSITADYN